MGQKKPIILCAKISAAYTITNAWANITGLVLPSILEDGWYDLEANCNPSLGADNRGAYIRFAVNGNPVSGTETLSYGSGVSDIMWNYHNSKTAVFLKKGDIVSLQAIYNTAATAIQYVAGTREGYIQATKRG